MLEAASNLTLQTCPIGQSSCVVRMSMCPEDCRRLRELGIGPGVTLVVAQGTAFGGRLVQVGADRFALDAATAAGIEVECVG
jgi:ferrous iron transport protein A